MIALFLSFCILFVVSTNDDSSSLIPKILKMTMYGSCSRQHRIAGRFPVPM